MEFKKRIKMIREEQFLSQEAFAKELGVSFATINRWEAGTCYPNYRAKKILHEYCQKLGKDFAVFKNEK